MDAAHAFPCCATHLTGAVLAAAPSLPESCASVQTSGNHGGIPAPTSGPPSSTLGPPWTGSARLTIALCIACFAHVVGLHVLRQQLRNCVITYNGLPMYHRRTELPCPACIHPLRLLVNVGLLFFCLNHGAEFLVLANRTCTWTCHDDPIHTWLVHSWVPLYYVCRLWGTWTC